jgi:hypothetical protein
MRKQIRMGTQRNSVWMIPNGSIRIVFPVKAIFELLQNMHMSFLDKKTASVKVCELKRAQYVQQMTVARRSTACSL